MPGGKPYGTENGCFAKTFSLDPDFEPNIYNAVVKPTTYLENVYQDDHGKVNFFEESYTQNGRAVFRMDDLARYPGRHGRRHGRLPVDPEPEREHHPRGGQARPGAGGRVLHARRDHRTSAGGASEAGKFLRVPGTNPFFPLPTGCRAIGSSSCSAPHPIETYLLNTGRVGGEDGDERSKKVKIPHTSACVEGIAERTISWTEDDDFGYRVAEAVPEFDDVELLQPRRLYEREGACRSTAGSWIA